VRAQVSCKLLLLQRTGELKAAHREAMAHTQAKADFLASVSHELRTPLHSVAGFTELIGGNVQSISAALSEAKAALASGDLSGVARFIDAAQQSSNESEAQVRHVLSGARILSSIVNDVLDLSQINAGKLEVCL
jgi:signal transduction histidine kinase